MTTKKEFVAALKAENATLRAGSEEAGYVDLIPEEYEETISQWADNLLANEAKAAEEALAAIAKADAIEKLTALGIDPKTLGLSVEQSTENVS
jgi:hypothetical protein